MAESLRTLANIVEEHNLPIRSIRINKDPMNHTVDETITVLVDQKVFSKAFSGHKAEKIQDTLGTNISH